MQTEAPPPVPGAKPVIVERIKVHGAALERNLEGNAADRDVLVVLPPSYAKEKSCRYAVVYVLHGWLLDRRRAWSRLTLKRGANVIRAAVVNGGGATDFCARFLDGNDRPITTVAVALPTNR